MRSINPLLRKSWVDKMITHIIFRVVLLFLLVILSIKPVMVRPDPGLPKQWVLLADTSKSMRVKDPVGRLKKAKEIMKTIIDKYSDTHLFQFSETSKEISKEQIENLKSSGRKTQMADALKNVFEENDFRGAIVLTDGRQVGGGDPVTQAASLGRPLLMVGLGNRSLFKDVAVRSIQSPPFAFKNIQTSLSATLSVVGYAGQKITVKLKQGKKILSLQTIQVSEPDVETSVNFSWVPTTLGSKVLTVEASKYAGEVTTLNNRKDITLDVGRDRFRVLYICGHPGPEYGFLRYQFKRDPAVELVTFVILRNASNIVTVPDSELSLIPFPTQDVLIRQMATFDLVVFEEFAYRQFGLMPNIMYAIKKKVEDGGSFLLMGAEKAFDRNSHYNISGVKDMIPIQFAGVGTKTIQKEFNFTPKALLHPILRLDSNPDQNKKVWSSLPPLDGFYPLPGVKPGAIVIGEVNYKNKKYPLLTVWKFGKGRVATLATRTTWRWSMLPGKKDHTSFAYQQFWKNMVLWLTHSNEFKPVRMALDNKNMRIGDTESLRVWAYDEYFKPISDVNVKIMVTSPDGQETPLKPHQETTGVYMVPFKGEQLGEYKAQAWVLRKGKKLGRDNIKFRVLESHFEEEDLRPDFNLLKEIAHSSGGKFITGDEFSLSVFKEFNEEISKTMGKKILLWNSPWLLILILLFLIVDWVICKRKGLP